MIPVAKFLTVATAFNQCCEDFYLTVGGTVLCGLYFVKVNVVSRWTSAYGDVVKLILRQTTVLMWW